MRRGDADNLAFVAACGLRLVGILCCGIFEEDVLGPRGARVARLDLIGVAHQFRRGSVATKLWRRMEARLAKMGMRARPWDGAMMWSCEIRETLTVSPAPYFTPGSP